MDTKTAAHKVYSAAHAGALELKRHKMPRAAHAIAALGAGVGAIGKHVSGWTDDFGRMMHGSKSVAHELAASPKKRRKKKARKKKAKKRRKAKAHKRAKKHRKKGRRKGRKKGARKRARGRKRGRR